MTNETNLSPTTDFISHLEKNGFNLLHKNTYENTDYYIYFHKKYNIPLEFQTEENYPISFKGKEKYGTSTYPIQIRAHTQFLFNYNKKIFKTIEELNYGSNTTNASGYGTSIQNITYELFDKEKAFIFINALNEIHKIYPNFFCKQHTFVKPQLKKEFIINNQTDNIKILMEQTKNILENNKQLQKVYCSPLKQEYTSTTNAFDRWNTLIKSNLLATNQHELNSQDLKTIKQIVNIINSNKTSINNDEYLYKNTSIGINIFHAIPFIEDDDKITNLFTKINNTLNDNQILDLLNSTDNFGNTPILYGLKQIEFQNGLQEKITRDFIRLYSKKFGKQLILNNDKETIANAITSGNVFINANIFRFICELDMEWWHVMHQKKHVGRRMETVTHTTTDISDVIFQIECRIPKEYCDIVNDNYIKHQKKQLELSITDSQKKIKIKKI